MDSEKTDLPLYMCLYFVIFTLILVDSVEFDSNLCCFVFVIRGILKSFFCNVTRIALTCTSLRNDRNKNVIPLRVKHLSEASVNTSFVPLVL